ncbi:MAG: hypothetical protein WBC44_18910 [Planctomycetaceae bacterium]
MQQSIWKLAAVVGVSGLGFLVILQVQKGLHDAGMIQAAELDPNAAQDSAGRNRQAASQRSAPEPPKIGVAHVVSLAENPFADVESAGLDFRDSVPELQGEIAKPTPTAEAELIPVPQVTTAEMPTSPAVDPFADIRQADDAGSTPAEIVPVGHDEPSLMKSAGPGPSGEMLAQSGDVSDFGPDPFADLEAPTPDPNAAGLEDQAASGKRSSLSRQLQGSDPFAAPSAETMPADGDPFGTVPESPESVPAEPVETEPMSPFDDPFGSATVVPVDGAPSEQEKPPADAVETEDPFGDAPFGDAPITEREPAVQPESNPFGDAVPMTESSDPPAATPEPPASSGPPMVSPTDAPFDFGTSPIDPDPSREPLDTPAFEESPTTRPAPPAESPRLLPTDEPNETPGAGTVSPSTPRGPQKAELTVEKKAPSKAILGQPLVYEIHVMNVGDSAAHEVTVSDVVPKGTELVGTIPRAVEKEQKLVWNLETLAPGESKLIKVKVTPVEPGQIGSVATVNFVSEVAAETKVVAPHLTLRIVAPPSVTLGQPVDFRFEIANKGTAAAEKVMLRDLLPAGFEHVDGHDLEYEVGTLPPGETEAVTLRVSAVKPGSFTNKAVVTASGGLKTEAVAEVAVASSRVTVSRRGPKRRVVGRPATYHNIVRNGSDRPAGAVDVIEEVPAGMDFVSASHSGQFDPDRRTIAWRIDALAPGEEQTLQVVLTAATEGEQDSVVHVEEAGSGPIELTSSTEVTGTPQLSPSLQGLDEPIVVGERAAFRIRVSNRGNADADGVTVGLDLPSHLKLVDVRGGTVQNDRAGRSVVRLASPVSPGGEQSVDFVIESESPGKTTFRAEVNAPYMASPLIKDQELVIAPRSR